MAIGGSTPKTTVMDYIRPTCWQCNNCTAIKTAKGNGLHAQRAQWNLLAVANVTATSQFALASHLHAIVVGVNDGVIRPGHEVRIGEWDIWIAWHLLLVWGGSTGSTVQWCVDLESKIIRGREGRGKTWCKLCGFLKKNLYEPIIHDIVLPVDDIVWTSHPYYIIYDCRMWAVILKFYLYLILILNYDNHIIIIDQCLGTPQWHL